MFGRKKEEYQAPVYEEPVQEIAKPEPKPVTPSTVIGKGVIVVGNFDSKEPIEVLGTIRGNIRSTSSVSIKENGSLVGEAALKSLDLEGRAEGTVLCSDETVIRSTGALKGNLSTASLRTDDGSAFEGKLNMVPKPPVVKTPEPAEDVQPVADAQPIEQ